MVHFSFLASFLFRAAQGAITFTSVAVPSPTDDAVGDLVENRVPASFTFTFDHGAALAVGQTITLVSSEAMWKSYYSHADTDCTLSIGGVSDAGMTFTVDFDLRTSVFSPSAAVSAADTIIIVCSANLHHNAPKDTNLRFTLSSTTETSAVTDNSLTIILGADPITVYNGVKTKFWFPIGKLVPLLKTADLTVSASVFQGPKPDMQWFERFVLTKPDGLPVADMQMSKQKPNRTLVKKGGFYMMDVRLGQHTTPADTMKFNYEQQVWVGDVKMVIGSRPHNSWTGATTTQEYVYVETNTINFAIMTSHAGSEFGSDLASAVKYTHLDMLMVDMRAPWTFQGMLPQFWGLKPMSAEAKAYLTWPIGMNEEDETPMMCVDKTCGSRLTQKAS